MTRTTLILLVALLALSMLAGGCGDAEPRIELRFAVDIERAVAEGRIETDADRERVFADTLAVVRTRLDRYGVDARVRVLGQEGFDIAVPVDQRSSLESLVQVVTAVGDLRFRIEVLPTAMYRQWREDGKTPPRLEKEGTHPWKGTVEEFGAFKEEEVRRFKEARDNATAYKPSRPGEYFVVPRQGTEATHVHDFAVLEQPQNELHRVDGSILKNPITGKDPNTGKPIVLYEVKTAYQNMFREWTGQNVGLPLAIVLNGVYRSAPIINSALSDYVQITLGAGSWRELEKEAEELTSVLEAGTLHVQPTLVSVHDPAESAGGR